MKKSFLLSCLAVALLTVNQGYAQKCETGKDPFTGEPAQIFKYKDNSLILENKGGKVKLTVVNVYDGERNVMLPSGTDVQLKLDNDEVISLKTVNDAPPKSQLAGVIVYTNYAFTFDLDQQTLKKLADHLITLFRFPDANGGYMDREVKGGRVARYVKNIQKGANCMLGRDGEPETQGKKKSDYNDEN
jgi:hypothetical protein